MKRRHLIQSALLGLAPFPLSAKEKISADVLVVGSGAAGLSAALEASESGAEVVLIEKMSFLGGSTLLSGGYFSAAGTEIQKKAGVEDSAERFLSDILEAGRGLNDPQVAKTLADGSAQAFEWLQSHGISFEDRPYQIYGSRFPRCYKPVEPRGTAYIQSLSDALQNRKNVRILTDCVLKGFSLNHDGSAEVRLSGKTELAGHFKKGIVLASGGYGADREFLKTAAPKFAGCPFDTSPSHTAETLLMARKAGAELLNLDKVEAVPEGSRNPLYTAHLYTLLDGLVFVNRSGRRFVDEKLGRSEIADALMREGEENCFMIVPESTVARLDKVQRKNIYRALFEGEAWRGETLEELAFSIKLPASELRRSVQEGCGAVSAEPYWAYRTFLWVHYTCGGVRISPQGECLDAGGVPIPGLYAAGQICGNVHGANRLGGNGLTDAVVFGRIAGKKIVNS